MDQKEREQAKVLDAVRLRAEEAEATAAYLANEATRLRQENRELIHHDRNSPRHAVHVPRPAPPLMGPALPKSLTQASPVSPDHFGVRGVSGSPGEHSPRAPYHALGDTAAPTASRAVPSPQLQHEARQWQSAKRSAPPRPPGAAGRGSLPLQLASPPQAGSPYLRGGNPGYPGSASAVARGSERQRRLMGAAATDDQFV